MPNPIQTVRTVIYFINVVARNGKKILRMVVPIISVVATVAQEIKRKN